MNLKQLKDTLNKVKDDSVLERFAFATCLSTEDPTQDFGLIFRMESGSSDERGMDARCEAFLYSREGKRLANGIIKPLNRDHKLLNKVDRNPDAYEYDEVPDW
jgi:hypothetical protein